VRTFVPEHVRPTPPAHPAGAVGHAHVAAGKLPPHCVPLVHGVLEVIDRQPLTASLSHFTRVPMALHKDPAPA